MRSTSATWVGGLVVGLVLGVLARAVMRLVTVIEDGDPEFTWAGTTLIVSLFVLSAAGATAAGRLQVARWVRALIAALFALPVAFFGIAIGAQEIIWATEGEVGGVVVVVVALAGVIAMLVIASVVLPWRRAVTRVGSAR